MNKRIILSALVAASSLLVTADDGRKRLLNNGWRFHLTDSATITEKVTEIQDSLWQNISLPHDWSVLQPFDKDAAPGNDGAYLPGGVAWYTTNLNIDQDSVDRVFKLYFEGVYERSEVYVNGKLAGGHPYGYSSFFVDITPYIKEGENAIAVRVDNSNQKNCRWYSGSGIYRNVWVKTSDKVRIGDWGIAIQTPKLNTANISVDLENKSSRKRKVLVKAEVAGVEKEVALSLNPSSCEVATFSLVVPDAKAWTTDSPNLYTAKISVKEDGEIIDSVEQPFGFRTISYSATDGFALNGKPMILNGGCVHHDNGILGAAAYDRAERRKAEMLKEAGFNAVRTSHNLPSEAFLTACDELGLLVIDEAFDGWRDAKNSHDYHLLFDKWAERDAAIMVRRDRNHPSIFCWSIGNEIIERKSAQAVKDANMLAEVCRSIDPTRPITQALAAWDADWEIYDPLAAEHDIVGYNYMIHKAEGDHERVPERVMMQTESYPRDAWNNYRMTRDHSYIIGDFVWTAIDYIGESGIGRWYYEGDVEGEHYHRPLYPWHAAYCGDVDLTGLRKPISHYRSMLWNENGEKLYMAVCEPDGYNGKIKTTQWGTWPTFESWNWPGYEGLPIDVEVYSRYPRVRLYLNDNLVGEMNVEQMKASFTLPYTPGILRADGIDNGRVCESVELATAGSVADIRLTADRANIAADGMDLSFITIECVDADGHVVPVADDLLTISVEGPASLIALGNADIKDCDPYYDNTHHVWKGRALAVVRSGANVGSAIIKVTTQKIERTIKLECK